MVKIIKKTIFWSTATTFLVMTVFAVAVASSSPFQKSGKVPSVLGETTAVNKLITCAEGQIFIQGKNNTWICSDNPFKTVITGNGQPITLNLASATTDGILSKEDYSYIFNHLQNSSSGLRTDCGVGQIVKFNGSVWACANDNAGTGINSASLPISYNPTTGNISISKASLSADGYLSSDDWNNFNSKEVSLNFVNGITRTGNSVGLGGSLTSNVSIDNGIHNFNLTGSGNVGIGTNSPLGSLDVNNSFYTSPGTINVRAQDNIYEGGQINLAGGGNNRYFSIDNYQGALRFISQDNVGESPKMTILNNGRVGINTNNPTTEFDVNGGIRVNSITISNGASNGYILTSDNSGNGSWQSVASFGLPSGTGGQTFRHDGSNWVASSLLFNNGTNIGINNTNPQNRLDVSGTVQATGLKLTSSPSNGYILTSDNSGNASWQNPNVFAALPAGNSGETMRYNGTNWVSTNILYNNGVNIGVNTTSPNFNLDVNGSLKATTLSLSNGASNGYVLTSDNSGNASWQSVTSFGLPSATSGQTLRYNGSAWVSNSNFYNDGFSVGIGTTNPGNKLDVNGTIQATGFRLTSSYSTGYILTSDNAGYASWQPAPVGTLPTGSSGQTIRNDGTSWVTNNFLFNNGSQIGVNTTNPSTTLDVNGATKTNGLTTATLKVSTSPAVGYVLTSDGSGNATWQAPFAGSGVLPFATTGQTLYYDGTNWTASSVIYNSGTKVGVNTSIPQQDLSVNGGANIDQGDYNNGSLVSALTFGNGSAEGIASKRNGGGNQYGLDFYTNNLTRLSIKQNGNIGINNTNPGYNLDINGALRLQPLSSTPSTNNGVMYYDSTLNKFRCYENSAWKNCITTGGGGGGNIIDGSVTGQTLYWDGTGWDVNSNIFNDVINSKVGINTATPQNTLDVNGSLRIGNFPIYSNPNTLGFNENNPYPGNNHQTAYHFTSGDQNKNVVFSFAKTNINTGYFGNDGSNIYFGNERDNQGAFIFKKAVGFQYDINTSGTELMRIDNATGNIGINNNNPQYKLDVNGDIKTTGAFYGSGNLGVVLNAADAALITRAHNPFTSGGLSGAGRWGLFMQPSALTLGIPNDVSGSFKFATYSDNSNVAKNLVDISQSGTISLSQSGQMFQSYNEDSHKVKFANWYSSNSDQFGQGQMFQELWFGAINGNSQRRIGFYLNTPLNGDNGSFASNADMTLTTTGLGIGNTNPSYKLDVNGSIRIGNFPVNSSTKALSFNTSDDTPGTLSQTAYSFFSGDPGKNVLLTLGKTDVNTMYIAHDGSNFILANERSTQGAFIFKKNVGYGANITNTGDELLRIDNNTGNVGIGTNNPLYKLDVNGSTNINGALTASTLKLTTGAANGYVLVSDGAGNASWSGSSGCVSCIVNGGNAGQINVGTTDWASFNFITSNTQKMQIAANGKITLGSDTTHFTPVDIINSPEIWNDNQASTLFADNRTYGIGVGGGIAFGGKYNIPGDYAEWAGIKGVKENAANNDASGALIFSTRQDGGQTTERLRINSSGNVGIGTNSISAKLHVQGDEYVSGGLGIGTLSNSQTKLFVSYTGSTTGLAIGAQIDNLRTNTTTDDLYKYGLLINSTGNFTGSTGGSTYNYGLYVNNVTGADVNYGAFIGGSVGINNLNPTYTLDVTGNIRATTGFNGSCRTDGSVAAGPICNQDVAEVYDTTESMQQGDLVSVDKNEDQKISKSSVVGDYKLLGIVSTTAGLVFNQGDTQLSGNTQDYLTSTKAPVALSGKVPVKISTINGNIKKGDVITSSAIKGFGQKATARGYVVGKALEDFDPTASNFDKKKIISCSGETDSNIKCGKIMVFINLTYYQPEGLLDSITNNSVPAYLTTQVLTINKVVVGNNNVVIDDLGNISIEGNLIAKGLTKLQNVTAENITVKNLQVESIKAGDDLAGEIAVSQGKTEATFKFANSKLNEKYIVTLTPYDSIVGSFYVSSRTKDGFTIKLENIQKSDVNFGWSIIEK